MLTLKLQSDSAGPETVKLVFCNVFLGKLSKLVKLNGFMIQNLTALERNQLSVIVSLKIEFKFLLSLPVTENEV